MKLIKAGCVIPQILLADKTHDKTTQLQIGVTFQRKQRGTEPRGWDWNLRGQKQEPKRIFPSLET